MAYNQGFSFLLYLETNYPGVSLATLCAHVKKIGFALAFKLEYDKSLDDLYQEWKQGLASQFAPIAKTAPIGQRLFDHQGIMDIETASADNGRFVVANWGNDYERFNLFRRLPQGGYEVIARDTGPCLSYDPATDSLWFTQSVYDGRIGNAVFDIFRLDKNNGIERITEGKRCMAFDQQNGMVIYAYYQNGMTNIIRRTKEGKPESLYGFHADSAVYSISIIDADHFLLNVGNGRRVQLAILSGRTLSYYRPDQEILDAVYVGGNRAVITSTISGSPQLYWVDLSSDSKSWHKISDAQSGARLPSITLHDGTFNLTYSEYLNGSFHMMAADIIFSDDQKFEAPIAVDPENQAGNAQPGDGATPLPFYNKSDGAIVMYPFPVVFVLNADRYPLLSSMPTAFGSASNTAMAWTGEIGAGFQLGNAPGSLTFALSGWFVTPLFTANKTSPSVYIDSELDFDLGPTRNTIFYELGLVSHFNATYQRNFSYTTHDLTLQSSFQLNDYNALTLFAGLYSETATTYVANNYFVVDDAGLRWNYRENTNSNFDPAHLGQNSNALSLQLQVNTYQFPVPGYFYSYQYATDHATLRISSSNLFRALSADSTFSAAFSFGGFANFFGISGNQITPDYLGSLGGSSFFSGYPRNYAGFNTLGWASAEIKTNPFVNTHHHTEWYERLNLSLKLSGGYGQYFSIKKGSLQNAIPVSAEVGLNAYFYARDNQESQVSLWFAMPFNDFMADDNGALNLPFQLYANFSF